VNSIEHEAAHVAFGIPSRDEGSEAAVDGHVRECRGGQPKG